MSASSAVIGQHAERRLDRRRSVCGERVGCRPLPSTTTTSLLEPVGRLVERVAGRRSTTMVGASQSAKVIGGGNSHRDRRRTAYPARARSRDPAPHRSRLHPWSSGRRTPSGRIPTRRNPPSTARRAEAIIRMTPLSVPPSTTAVPVRSRGIRQGAGRSPRARPGRSSSRPSAPPMSAMARPGPRVGPSASCSPASESTLRCPSASIDARPLGWDEIGGRRGDHAGAGYVAESRHV